MCEDLTSVPPEHHESVIARWTDELGYIPDRIYTKNPRLVDPVIARDQFREPEPELDSRRDIEGNTELARMPLALPTTYRYPPLPSGHARFLRLAGTGPFPMGSLETHPLEDPPPYVAVSYFWDATSPKRGMWVDTQSLGISETVLEVLNQVVELQRWRRLKRLVWVDQICINQDDKDEKSDQIYRMGEIYSKAEEVFVWLGPTAHESDAALENMEHVVQSTSILNRAVHARVGTTGLVAIMQKDHGQVYGRLLMRPWFRRLWTVQEALLARKLVVMCGYREVDFTLLARLALEFPKYRSLDWILFPGASDEDLNSTLRGICRLHTLRVRDALAAERGQGLGSNDFRMLVSQSRERQVTMAPDRVHALMGVAPRRVREHMASVQAARSDQSLWQLYTEFAMCMLENDAEWRFLSLAPSEDRPRELPSWVPNLNSRRLYASDLTGELYHLSAGISPGTRHLDHRVVTSEALVARGFRVGTVDEIIPQTAFTRESANTELGWAYGRSAQEWEQKCRRLCQRVHNMDPYTFPTFHVDILLAQSATKPVLDGRALDAYKIFMWGCDLCEAPKAILEQDPLPEYFRDNPDAVEGIVDRGFKVWQDNLSAAQYELLLQFTGRMETACSGRPYINTSAGLMGLGYPGVRVGDMICILYGTTVPYVLRPRPDGAMTLVGDAYINDIMDGQALSLTEKSADEMFQIR